MGYNSVSPIDGRYEYETEILKGYFSESALIKYRVLVEIEWLIYMSNHSKIIHVRKFTKEEYDTLMLLYYDFNKESVDRVKEIEEEINHDVKAVEYFIKETLEQTSLKDIKESVHFACTSEDINNIAYALMIRNSLEGVWEPPVRSLIKRLETQAHVLADIPMLSHTHGQPATPTTMGKELNVFSHRLDRQFQQIQTQSYLGKFNGAVGSYNAHHIAYPNIDWQEVSRSFVTERFGLEHNPLTTQIESHDYLAELAHKLVRFNIVLTDFCKDMWAYVSREYFTQMILANQVGSSTMPHKINPIDFEKAESNLGMSNAILNHLAMSLPVSRLQRDLSDSSSLRNYGVGIAHSLIGITSSLKGFNKLTINSEALEEDLLNHWEILGEAFQTILRKNNVPDSYEKIKELTKGKEVTAVMVVSFINSIDILDEDRQRLKELTPLTYTGLAEKLGTLTRSDILVNKFNREHSS